MDNNKDKQFYWEVKDFMAKKPNLDAGKSKNSLINDVKSILEQDKAFRQSSFDVKSPHVNVTHVALNLIQNREAGYRSTSPAYTSNKNTNPFQILNEGIFDWFSGSSQKPKTEQEQRMGEMRARSDKFVSMTPQQRAMEQETSGKDFTSTDVFAGRDRPEEQDPSVPLSKDEIRRRDLEGQLKASENIAAEQEAEEKEMAGVKPGDYSSPTGQRRNIFVNRTNAPAKPATPGVDVEGPPSSLNVPSPSTPTTPTPSTPVSTQASESDYAKARRAGYERGNVQKQREAEERLARIGQIDMSKQSSHGRMVIAVNKLRAEREARGETVLSKEQIDSRVKRDVETKDRLDREKMGDKSGQLASKNLLNVRDQQGKVKTPAELAAEKTGEETKLAAARETAKKSHEAKIAAAAKNPPASQTAPQSYRI